MKYVATAAVLVLLLAGLAVAAAPQPGGAIDEAFRQIQAQLDSADAKNAEQDARLDALEGQPPPPPSCTGLAAAYYAGRALSGAPILTACEPAPLNVDWGTGGPTGRANDFSARYTGTFGFQAGTYLFTARADDGIRVFVDDVNQLDRWVDQSATTYTFPLALTAGNHAVRVEYYENTGFATVSLGWTLGSSGGLAAPAFQGVG